MGEGEADPGVTTSCGRIRWREGDLTQKRGKSRVWRCVGEREIFFFRIWEGRKSRAGWIASVFSFLPLVKLWK